MPPVSRVARLIAPRSLVWETEDVPAPKEKQFVARTIASAISPGTEVAAFIGMPPLRPMNPYPRLVGYCNVAEIEATGLNSAFRVGQRVLTHMSHRSLFVADDDAVLSIVTSDVDAGTASTAYLFHLGYSAALKGDISAGDEVAVIGLGTLGLTSIAMASNAGASVDGYSARKPDVAYRFGARSIGTAEEAPLNSYDVVITTSNSWDDWGLALRISRPGGTIIVLGFPGRGQPAPLCNPLASQFLYDKQLTISACGIVNRPEMKRNMEWIAELITTNKLAVEPLVSETVPASTLALMYERLADREPNLLTAVLTW